MKAEDKGELITCYEEGDLEDTPTPSINRHDGEAVRTLDSSHEANSSEARLKQCVPTRHV